MDTFRYLMTLVDSENNLILDNDIYISTITVDYLALVKYCVLRR